MSHRCSAREVGKLDSFSGWRLSLVIDMHDTFNCGFNEDWGHTCSPRLQVLICTSPLAICGCSIRGVHRRDEIQLAARQVAHAVMVMTSALKTGKAGWYGGRTAGFVERGPEVVFTLSLYRGIWPPADEAARDAMGILMLTSRQRYLMNPMPLETRRMARPDSAGYGMNRVPKDVQPVVPLLYELRGRTYTIVWKLDPKAGPS
ncbi:hypothetical protein EDD18DRAFT_1228552 [Armillaria luteobubalina]|uniref:Uncharacterized protein n=1 Tax=Armillaria luteobubalina TaxID=153913 RepID=A0AA39NW10_9AGAR|nr:hypothetical protein EDD18DRAFT_1228552 [Armillaria luteobubalina]